MFACRSCWAIDYVSSREDKARDALKKPATKQYIAITLPVEPEGTMTVKKSNFTPQTGVSRFRLVMPLQAFLAWSSVCLHAAAFVIRPYRVWKLLVKHDGKMWRTE